MSDCSPGPFRNQHEPRYSLLGLYALLVYFSAQLHELGHWLVAKVIGLDFVLGFNRWQILSGATAGEKLAVLIAGPAVTLALILAGFLIFLWMETGKRFGLMLAISNSLIMLFPNLIGLVGGGLGDTGWIALYLNRSPNVIKVPLVVGLLITTVAGLRCLEPGMKRGGWLLGLLLIPVPVMAATVLLDRVAWYSYESGKLLLPVLGISLLTLLVNGFLALLLILWRKRIR